MQSIPTLSFIVKRAQAQNEWHNSPQACDGSSRVQIGQSLSTGLQRTTKAEDNSSDQDGILATQGVARRTGYCSAEKCTASKNGHNSSSIDLVSSILEGTRKNTTYISLSFGLNLEMKDCDAITWAMTPRS
jgi:hypothetical protein